ncbi:hypothetical protein Ahy_B04g071162 [Arachis hypogaea]|uniref:Uncharacterized protein n=1 Tax=Arachis hypogaea TaxID=3818 RepID=A0A444ZK63_ARAHY|nr:hypothetical protein Ahy_B04g071162 [Arachis hypogaea]
MCNKILNRSSVSTGTHSPEVQESSSTIQRKGELHHKVFTAILHCAYDNVVVELQELKAKRKGTCSLSHEDANLESVNELQSPPRVRTRGCPKIRLGSKLDKQIANALKKKENESSKRGSFSLLKFTSDILSTE